jgi:iron complex transport system substrate-binding protein
VKPLVWFSFRTQAVIALVLLLTLTLTACGDSTATPASTTTSATTAPTTVAAATVTVAATTAPATTTAAGGAATTAAVTTVAPTTAAATQATATASATTAATTSSSAGQFPVTVKDLAGANVTLTKAPQRIICLSIDCPSIMFELGLEPLAVPNYGFDFGDPVLTDPKYFGTKASKFIRVNGSSGQYDMEQIASLKPDLIVVENSSQTLDTFRGLAPTFATSYKDINESIETLRGMGQLTGRSSQAETAIKQFQDRLNTYATKSPKTKKVLYIQIYDVSFTAFDTSTTGQVLKEITPFPWHLDNDTSGIGWGSLSLEEILQVNPDVIFVGGFYGDTIAADNKQLFEDSKQQLTSSPFWQKLNAVKNNQIYQVNSFPWAGAGILALNQIMDDAATKLYPDVFPKALP